MSDACLLAIGSGALISWRALFERSELARAPKVRVCPIGCGQAGRQWFWLLLPPQQRWRPSGRAKQQARLPGRDPVTLKITWT
jgi:hypothetical protein